MARFRVIRELSDAVYREIYFVDASSEDEAQRKVVAGQATCHMRYFQTRGGLRSVRFKINQVDNVSYNGTQTNEFPTEVLPEFMNGVFKDPPGSDIQMAIQQLQI